ncbi:hypothetical protein KOR34_09070 [Posidoniimonas corsicana]|uniref:Autotransporter-associated beta strand repeat protein n=1 Tax=Posidoniimonas corsicana TaxID=1938618 RepID=A0A5C5VDI7_9BACT|nr:hypothetical protein [Posidoniimonas corsicana]TWT36010.1 hypothetical protein KOR34_09070 [Posidoniimonas corsicana]
MTSTSTPPQLSRHTPFTVILATALLPYSLAAPSYAQLGVWSADDGGGVGSGTGDFFDPSNWHNGVVPIGNNRAPTIRDGGTAILNDPNANVDTEGLVIGDAPNSSGTLQIDSGSLTVYDAASSVLGNNAGGQGTLIMNGGYLEFGDVDGNGPGSGGAKSLVIANASGTTGRLEMHNDAVLRSLAGFQFANGSEADLPQGTPGLPSITIIMDGAADASAAGGITLRGGNLSMTLSDDAQMTLGNSLGPADPNGHSAVQNGHFNVGARYGATADIVVEGNAVFNLDALYNEKSELTLTVRDNGEFNIFNTATGGTETDFGMQSYLSREINSNYGVSSTVVTVEGSGRFTVNSRANTVSIPGNKDHPLGHADLISTDGLILAGGDLYPITHCGQACNGRYPGGVALVDVKQNAEFSVVQTLWMTAGGGGGASSTLKITGPDATVSLGDLVMAESIDQKIVGGSVVFGDPLWIARPGTAELHSVITGSSHSTIQVTDDARIGNGELVIELSGYSPVPGDSYTLLQTGDPNGVEGMFKGVDFSLAPLSEGLSWELVYNADSVVLSVVGESSVLPGDFNNDGVVDAADYTVWRDNLGAMTEEALNGAGSNSGGVDIDDYNIWKTRFGSTSSSDLADSSVPEPSASLLTLAFSGLLACRLGTARPGRRHGGRDGSYAA